MLPPMRLVNYASHKLCDAYSTSINIKKKNVFVELNVLVIVLCSIYASKLNIFMLRVPPFLLRLSFLSLGGYNRIHVILVQCIFRFHIGVSTEKNVQGLKSRWSAWMYWVISPSHSLCKMVISLFIFFFFDSNFLL